MRAHIHITGRSILHRLLILTRNLSLPSIRRRICTCPRFLARCLPPASLPRSQAPPLKFVLNAKKSLPTPSSRLINVAPVAASRANSDANRFTPVAAEWYLLAKNPALEIIFVSADEDADGFAAYFATMPWAAIAFEGTADAREALSSKFGVSGIPALIVVNPADCSVIDQNGRATLTANKSDPAACFAKWGC